LLRHRATSNVSESVYVSYFLDLLSGGDVVVNEKQTFESQSKLNLGKFFKKSDPVKQGFQRYVLFCLDLKLLDLDVLVKLKLPCKVCSCLFRLKCLQQLTAELTLPATLGIRLLSCLPPVLRWSAMINLQIASISIRPYFRTQK